MLKTKTWIWIIALALLVFGLLSWRTLTAKKSGSVVEIVQDGVVLREIDLSAVTQAERFTVEWREGGSNTVCVEPGRICVSEADCPDCICVRQGWLSDQATPIVCLPHRLVIRVKGETDVDAAVR